MAASMTCSAQGQSRHKIPLGTSRLFIDQLELAAGANLSFNHGNKFIENYKTDVIQNKRLMKPGYTFGLGVFCPLYKLVDLNFNVNYESKGTRAELNHPSSPVNDNGRQIIRDTYTYHYVGINAAPVFYLDSKKRIFLSVGAYYAFLINILGQSSIYDTQNVIQPMSGKFIGRRWDQVRDDGGISSSIFIAGEQSFEQVDWGLLGKIAYQIPINGSQRLSIQLSDNFGIHPVYNKRFKENLPEKNHTISLRLGYLIRLK